MGSAIQTEAMSSAYKIKMRIAAGGRVMGRPTPKERGAISFWALFTEPMARDGRPAVAKIRTPLAVTVANKCGVWFVEIEGIRQSHLKPSKSLHTCLSRAAQAFQKQLEPWHPAGGRPEPGCYRVWYEQSWCAGEWDGEDWHVWPHGNAPDRKFSSTVPPSALYPGDRVDA